MDRLTHTAILAPCPVWNEAPPWGAFSAGGARCELNVHSERDVTSWVLDRNQAREFLGKEVRVGQGIIVQWSV